MPYVLFEKTEDIIRITLNRPEKLNALSSQLLAELDDALDRAEKDMAAKVVILKGNGRAFSSGYDLARSPTQAPKDIVTELLDERANIRRLLRLWEMPKVTIAQVHGYCLAGGFEHAMACDIVIAGKKCVFGYPIIRGTGTPPGLLLPWLVNIRKAKELVFTGRTITGTEAEAIGLVNKAVEEERLEQEVNEMAGKIAEAPLDLLVLGKLGVNRAFDIMGIKASLESIHDIHVVGHSADSVKNFRKTVAEKGVKEALAERDSPRKPSSGTGG